MLEKKTNLPFLLMNNTNKLRNYIIPDNLIMINIAFIYREIQQFVFRFPKEKYIKQTQKACIEIGLIVIANKKIK